MWPYEYGNTFTTSSEATQAIYILIPAMSPDQVDALATGGTPATAAIPTGASAGAEVRMARNPLHAALRSGGQKNLTLPWLR